MRRRIELLLVPVLVLALTACGGLDDRNSGSVFQDQASQSLVGTAEEPSKPEVPEGALVDQSGD
ncbi:MAG: hypothetical protein IKN55_07705, partial [Oscillospiraceae bacterium]|nr:hypothetical protein [Oscillospiraceae bacterium]